MYRKIKKFLNIDDGEEDLREEIKPASKMSSYITKIQLMNPIGVYKRGYNLSFKTKQGNDIKEKYLLVEEKKFSYRLQFIILLMLVQSIGISFAMTASISIPWTFNIVIPFTLDFLPFDLKDLIDAFIHFIQELLRPLDPIIDLIEEIIKFFSDFNPAIVFTGTFWLFDYLGWIDSSKYLDIPDTYNNGSKTNMDILAYNLEQKYPGMSDLVVPFVIFMFSVISFFLLITKAKKLLFELTKEKKFKKNKKKMRKTLVSYFIDQNVVDIEYVENRSTRKKFISNFYYFLIIMGIFTSLSPMFLALVIIFF